MQRQLSRRGRWLRWVGVWICLIVVLAVAMRRIIGPFPPDVFIWASAFVVGSGLTFLLVPSPHDD